MVGESPSPQELKPSAPNFALVAAQIVKIERKCFPKHESLADSVDYEIRKKNSGTLFIEVDGEVIGYLMFSFPSSLSVSITKLAVKEGFRRRGHGETLLRAGIEMLRKRNVLRVSLHVDPKRIPALCLYQKIGFQIDTVVKGYYAPNRDAYRIVGAASLSNNLSSFHFWQSTRSGKSNRVTTGSVMRNQRLTVIE